MKSSILCLVAGTTLALAACSTSNSYARHESTEKVQFVNDMAYIHAVETTARKHGVGVVWVHPRRKAVPVTVADANGRN